jgi:hypothetical protein
LFVLQSQSFYRLSVVILFAALTTACASIHVVECHDPPQNSPDQPEFVKNWQKPLPDMELSAEQKVRYHDRNDELKTISYYHDIVLHPRATLDSVVGNPPHDELLVKTPVFLIGFEKPRRAAPAHVDAHCKGRDFTIDKVRPSDDPRRGQIINSICDVIEDRRPQLLTHVVAIDGVKNGGYGSASFLYNAYDLPINGVGAEGGTDEALYALGLDALAVLRSALREALAAGDITDVVVLSAGWNTRQREALYNVLDWMAFIGQAQSRSPRPYRPLYIAISWQSAWENKFLDMLGLSVTTKGNDADELGVTWVNRLIHDVVIPEAADRLVTLIGHSYGTRVLGTALYLREAIARPATPSPPPLAFVALQPAFPINRYGADAGKEPWFANTDPHALVVLTSSQYDKANSLLPWGRYVGGGGAVDRILENKNGNFNQFNCEVLEADASGLITEPRRLTRTQPHLVNANAFVSCHMPETGGGAHSDVFDASAGRLIAQVMDAANANLPQNLRSDGSCSAARK